MRRIGATGLGYGQTFLLIVGFLVASGLIFLFGTWVGKDLAERRLAQEERVVRGAVPAQPTPSEQTSVDVGFYEGLKAAAYQRLQATAAAATPTAGRAAQAPKPAPTETAKPAAPKATARATQAVRAKTPEATPRGEEWADAGWTVQVNATTNQQQANDLVKDLKAKGYDAYSVPVPMRGQTWYRVRVGRFSSREQAKAMEQRLKSDGLEDAYLTPR